MNMQLHDVFPSETRRPMEGQNQSAIKELPRHRMVDVPERSKSVRRVGLSAPKLSCQFSKRSKICHFKKAAGRQAVWGKGKE